MVSSTIVHTVVLLYNGFSSIAVIHIIPIVSLNIRIQFSINITIIIVY